jgi:hypothetical protein
MNLLDFYHRYPDESSCKLAFKAQRLSEGISCKKCGGSNHYWKKNREQWECKKCHYRTSLKSGTVMENSKLPYHYCFVAMHLLTSTKKSFSAKEIQRQLGHNRYQPIWEMLHKIRSVMGLRDDTYVLKGEVELDDGFFETVAINRNKEETLKRGRGSQKQTTVIISTESKTITDDNTHAKKYSKKKQLGFIKMKVITSLKLETVTPVVKSMVKKGSVIVSDGSNSFNELKEDYCHLAQVIPKKDIQKVLPWVHTVISNAKRMLLDVHHRIDDDFLQNYLNEFVYKLNRRHFKCCFGRLLTTAVTYRWNSLGESNG